jgi:hypothetical protein
MKLGCSSTSAQSIGSFNFELEVRVHRRTTANLKCLATAALAAPGPGPPRPLTVAGSRWHPRPDVPVVCQCSVGAARGRVERTLLSRCVPKRVVLSAFARRMRLPASVSVGFISRRDRDFALEPGDMPVYASVFVYTSIPGRV